MLMALQMPNGFKKKRKDHRISRAIWRKRETVRLPGFLIECNGAFVHYVSVDKRNDGYYAAGVRLAGKHVGDWLGEDLIESVEEAITDLMAPASPSEASDGPDPDAAEIGNLYRKAMETTGLAERTQENKWMSLDPEAGLRRCVCGTAFVGGFGAYRCRDCRADIKRANLRRASAKRAEARAVSRAAALTCRQCGCAITDSARTTKAFCSNKCRVAAFRIRRHNQPA
jgi:hypothetical protein